MTQSETIGVGKLLSCTNIWHKRYKKYVVLCYVNIIM